LAVFLGTPLNDLLGGSLPEVSGWLMAGAAAGVLIGVDAVTKLRRRPTTVGS
jgi:hypothetical protein